MKTTFITKLLPAIVALYLVSEALITVEAKDKACSRTKRCAEQECCVTKSPMDNRKICKPKAKADENCNGKYHCGCQDGYICKADKGVKNNSTSVCQKDDKAVDEWDSSSSEEMTTKKPKPTTSKPTMTTKKPKPTTSKPNLDSGEKLVTIDLHSDETSGEGTGKPVDVNESWLG